MLYALEIECKICLQTNRVFQLDNFIAFSNCDNCHGNDYKIKTFVSLFEQFSSKTMAIFSFILILFLFFLFCQFKWTSLVPTGINFDELTDKNSK